MVDFLVFVCVCGMDEVVAGAEGLEQRQPEKRDECPKK
jgi:hypothetical protein